MPVRGVLCCGVWHESALGHFRLKQRTLPPVHLRFGPKGDIRSLVRKMVVMGQFLPHAPTAKKATFCSRHTREVAQIYRLVSCSHEPRRVDDTGGA